MSVITKSLYEDRRKPTLNQQILETSSKKSSAQDIYQQVASDSLLVEDVFSAISDNKSLSLFNLIGIMSSSPISDVVNQTRINQLRDAGLITKKRARFVTYFAWEGSLRNPKNYRRCNPEQMETSGN